MSITGECAKRRKINTPERFALLLRGKKLVSFKVYQDQIEGWVKMLMFVHVYGP